MANAAEVAAGTHPRGFPLFTRQLAEGASSSFFETSAVAAEPQHPAGQRRAALPQGQRDDGDLAGDGRAPAAPHHRTRGSWRRSTARRSRRIVESDQRSRRRAHDEVGPDQLRRPHREGGRRSGHDLVLRRRVAGLLPDLRPADQPEHRERTGRASGSCARTADRSSRNSPSRRCRGAPSTADRSRRCVNRSFGIEVTFLDAPGAAERAMYFGLPPDRLFKAGHESAGVDRAGDRVVPGRRRDRLVSSRPSCWSPTRTRRRPISPSPTSPTPARW